MRKFKKNFNGKKMKCEKGESSKMEISSSDLDLVVFAAKEQSRQVSDLRESLEESDLPFRVDLFVWEELPDSFQKNIENFHAILNYPPLTIQV